MTQRQVGAILGASDSFLFGRRNRAGFVCKAVEAPLSPSRILTRVAMRLSLFPGARVCQDIGPPTLRNGLL